MARLLHAVVEKVEPGLFRASYAADPDQDGALPGTAAMPDSHIATSHDSVRLFVEQIARGLGYDGVAGREPPRCR